MAEFFGTDARTLSSPDVDVVLTTYDSVARHAAMIRKIPLFAVVLDEAQFCKNGSSKRRKAVARLHRGFTLALTGTPMENRIAEYLSILDLVLPGLARLEPETDPDPFIIERLANWTGPFVLRRTKDQVLTSLPAMRIEDVYLDLSPLQRTLYDRFACEAKDKVERMKGEKTAADDEPRGTVEVLAALTRLRQICIDPRLVRKESDECSPKITTVAEMIEKLRVSGECVLVFSQFTSALDLLEAELKERNLAFLRLDVTTPRAERGTLVEAFQSSESPLAFLISLRAGGTGLNLTRANKVLMLDNWWNPAVDAQAIARAHRIGQSQSVTIHRLVMKGTVEEKILKLQETKRALFEAVVGAPSAERQAKGGGLTKEDFEFLLS